MESMAAGSINKYAARGVCASHLGALGLVLGSDVAEFIDHALLRQGTVQSLIVDRTNAVQARSKLVLQKNRKTSMPCAAL